MYSKLEDKVILHFSKDGLIAYSKYCDYSKINPITIEEVKMYYELLKSNERMSINILKINHIICCLYYLSKNDQILINVFCKQIIEQLNFEKDVINEPNLILIYNIIEYEAKYLHSNKIQLEFLLKYLERFIDFPKTLEKYLLYKYYRGSIKLRLGDLEQANREYFETLSDITEDMIQKSSFISFIRIKNQLLNAKIIKYSQSSQNADLRQENIFLKDLTEEVKKDNKLLAMKLGFSLYSNFFKQGKYNDCIKILIDIKKDLKNEILSGEPLINGIDYYLSIASRLGYIGTLINDKKAITSCMKKIEKTLNIINVDTKDKKINSLKVTYSMLLCIMKINCKITMNKSKEIAANFKALFFPNLNVIKNNNYFNINYIVNQKNINDWIMNLNIINNMDYEISIYCKNLVESCINNNIIKKIPMQDSMVITFIFGIHDIINRLSESLCTDTSVKKQEEYKNKIIKYTNSTLEYIYNECENQDIFQTTLIKSTIIEIFSSYCHVFIYNKNMNMMKKSLNLFDELKKKMQINDSTPSYELINKIKGDFWYYNKDYKASGLYYESAIKLMKEDHPKKGILFFNLGFINYICEKKKEAIDNLNKCINILSSVENDKNIFDFYKRPGLISQKIKIAKRILTVLSNNK